jgi:hypothetical protein
MNSQFRVNKNRLLFEEKHIFIVTLSAFQLFVMYIIQPHNFFLFLYFPHSFDRELFYRSIYSLFPIF